MEQLVCPVDVISVCSADGEIVPLRFQLVGQDRELIRANIEKAVKIKEIPYVGVEAYIYLCSARVAGRVMQFELKYTIRSHTWCLLRRVS